MPRIQKSRSGRPVWSWALYDWASSAFATTVMAGFFPVFFKTFWSRGTDATLSTFRLGAAAVYVVAIVGFSGANVFYDSLLVVVAPAGRADFVSALGFSVGYLGGGVLFALNVAMTVWPGAFGLAGPAEAVRVSFLSVAAWWTAFSVPLVLWVRDDGATPPWRSGASGCNRCGNFTYWRVRWGWSRAVCRA